MNCYSKPTIAPPGAGRVCRASYDEIEADVSSGHPLKRLQDTKGHERFGAALLWASIQHHGALQSVAETGG